MKRGFLLASIAVTIGIAGASFLLIRHPSVERPQPEEARRILTTLRALPSTPLAAPQMAAPVEARNSGQPPESSATSVRVTLPRLANGAAHLEDSAAHASVDVALSDVRHVPAVSVDGYSVYPHAHVSGATILERVLPTGAEDFVSFEARPSAPDVDYQIALGDGVSGLRLVADTLEMVDGQGTPRWRAEPPYIVGADGARTEATLAVEGCAVDRDPSAPWSRSVTPPGARSCTVHVRWPDEEVVYPAVLDPRWTTTQNMTTTRQGHTATLLSTGNVLVVGGTSNGSTALASAELYNRTTGTWAATNPMTGARTLHTATQLGSSSNTTTSGKVLISGGLNGTTSQNTAQLYSPSAGTWTAAANLNAARHGHTATLLVDGRVLVTGGLNGTTTLNTAALYNPASGTGSWVAAAGILPSALKNHAAALLTTTNNQLSNKVLVFGGNSGSATVSGVYLFDPAQNAFSTQTSLPSAREGHTVTVLANGNLLVTGGKSGTTTLATTVLFNPSSGAGSWSSSGTMTVARQAHSATLIPTAIVSNGQVLVAGGSSGSATLSSAELWNGTTWALTTALLSAQQGHTATLLGNDAILIAGGVNGSTTVGAAQLYDASFGLSCTSSAQCVTGFCVNGVCCDSACNNGCGACNLSGKVGTCSPIAAGTVCRASAGTCDVAETCSGTSTSCPANAFAPSTTVCRASAGVCDVAENCTGSSATCPADGFQPTSTVCRASAGVCDVAESCTGTSAACPADGFKSSSTVCRASAGVCDVAESCTGRSAACPADGFLPATTVCRPLAGGCDIAESCTGTSATCPPDRVMPVDSICRPSAGPCDVPELCGGVTATCAPDQFQPAGTVCRAAAGVCDVAEACSGTSVTCPADGFLPRTTVCRPVAGNCDVAENCTGSAATCPTDAKAPNGSLCDDHNACTAGDTCQNAVCVGGPPVTCPTADQCHSGGGACIPATGCPAASPLADGAACSDGNACTQGETCQGGACQMDKSFPLLVNVPVNDLGNLGGPSSTAQGVSIGPDVVGTSSTATGQQHAFVSFGGGQPLFDISAQPGAPAQSTGSAINDTDMVVGSLPQPDGSSHVFSRTDATGVVNLGPVGDNSVATDTFAFQGAYGYAVNNSGQIAGVNTDAGQFRGFLYTPGTGFEDIGSLDGLSSWLFGLSDSGAAVGASLVPGAPTTGFERFGHAVLFNAATELVDLNNYVDPTSGLTLTLANGISGNYIVGGADLTGTALPFRLNTSTGTVDHFNGGWQGSSVATSVNSMGDTVGWGFMAAGDTQQSAFIYTDQLGFKNLNDVINPSLGWNLQVATGINERDDVVGWGYHNGASQRLHAPRLTRDGRLPVQHHLRRYRQRALRLVGRRRRQRQRHLHGGFRLLQRRDHQHHAHDEHGASSTGASSSIPIPRRPRCCRRGPIRGFSCRSSTPARPSPGTSTASSSPLHPPRRATCPPRRSAPPARASPSRARR